MSVYGFHFEPAQLLFPFVCLLPALLVLRTYFKQLKKSKLIFGFLFLYLLGCIFAGVKLADRQVFREKMYFIKSIQGLAPTYARELSRMGHQKVINEADPSNPIYIEMIERQKEWLRLNPSISDIYTFRKRADGKIIFLVDSETDYNHNGKYDEPREQRTSIGEVYSIGVDKILESFQGESIFDDKPYTDRWGTWVSIYEPMLDDQGNVEAVLGVDFDADSWMKHLHQARLLIWALVMMIAWSGTWACWIYLAQLEEREAVARAHEHDAENQSYVRAMIQNVPGIVYRALHDVQRTMLFISQPIREIAGYGADEFVSKQIYFSRLVYSEDAIWVSKAIHEAVEKHMPYDLNYRIVHRSGEVKWIHEKGKAFRDSSGEVKWLDGMIFDMSLQKKNEEKLVRYQNQLENITNAIPGMVYQYYWSPSGEEGMKLVSAGCLELFGLAKEEIEESIQNLWKIIHAADVPVLVKSIHESAENKSPWKQEFRIKTPTGAEKWIRGSSIPDPSLSKGAKIVWNGVMIDITSEKKF